MVRLYPPSARRYRGVRWRKYGPAIVSGSRARGAAAAAWAPTDVAGLQGWWKADGTLWQDSARTTPVTADGDPVGAWDDASGNGRHLLQATADARPTYQTNELNGKPVIRGDGTDDKMTVAVVTTSSVVTMFCVAKISEGGKFLANGRGNGQMFNRQAGGLRDFLAENVANQADDAMTAGWEVWVGTVSAAPLWVLRVNGAEVVLASNSATPIAPGTDTSIFQATGDVAAGDIAECGVYDSVLSAGNITLLETYLNTRFAIF